MLYGLTGFGFANLVIIIIIIMDGQCMLTSLQCKAKGDVSCKYARLDGRRRPKEALCLRV